MRSSLKCLLALVAVLTAVTALPARADLNCPLALSGVDVDYAGWVSVQISGNPTSPWILCNVNVDMTSVNDNGGWDVLAQTCRGWLAQLLLAKASGNTVTVIFSRSTGTPASCTSVPTYRSTPGPLMVISN